MSAPVHLFPTIGQHTLPTGLGLVPPPASLVSVPVISGARQPPPSSLVWSHQYQPIVSWSGGSPTLAVSEDEGPRRNVTLASAAGLSLSPATEPFSPKLVDRIQSGQFVDMRDLLTDNISLMTQLESVAVQPSMAALPGLLRPRLREVASITSWMYCYLAYVAIRSEDQATRDMLAYGRLIIREAQRHGGQGWLDYDRVFRQQAALDPNLAWNTLHPGIQGSTLVGGTSESRQFCTLCREADHASSRCALAYLQQPPPQPPIQPRSRPSARRRSDSAGICISWNRGSCLYPGACNFRHICLLCRQHHRACDCQDAQRRERRRDQPRQNPVRGPPTSRPQ